MFILLFNVYIFGHTGHSDARFDRLNEFKYCIESYSSINFDKIILYIKLEDRYQHRKEEILDHIHRCYDIKKTTVVWDKMYYQNEWKPILNEITKIYVNTRFHSDNQVIFSKLADRTVIISKNLNL